MTRSPSRNRRSTWCSDSCRLRMTPSRSPLTVFRTSLRSPATRPHCARPGHDGHERPGAVQNSPANTNHVEQLIGHTPSFIIHFLHGRLRRGRFVEHSTTKHVTGVSAETRGAKESFGSAHRRKGFRSRWYHKPIPQRSRSPPSSDSSSDRSWWKRTRWQSDFRRCPRLSNDKSCIRPGPIPRPDPIETLTTPWRQEPARTEAHYRPLRRRYTLPAQPRQPRISLSRRTLAPHASPLMHSTDSGPI